MSASSTSASVNMTGCYVVNTVSEWGQDGHQHTARHVLPLPQPDRQCAADHEVRFCPFWISYIWADDDFQRIENQF